MVWFSLRSLFTVQRWSNYCILYQRGYQCSSNGFAFAEMTIWEKPILQLSDRFSMIIEILSNLYSLTFNYWLITKTETGAELHKTCFTCLWKSSLKSSSVIGGFALRRLWNENAVETQNEKQVKRRFFLLFLFLYIIIVVHKLHLNCLLTRAMLSKNKIK